MRKDTMDRIERQAEAIKKRIAQLEKRGFRAIGEIKWHSGYVPRDERGVYLEEYKGRYGEGYILHMPCWESSRYHYIQYFVK